MSEKQIKAELSYAQSGVDIVAQAQLVEKIKVLAASTPREGVLAGVGGFAALFELPATGYQQPVLVSGSDGVGTKLMLANMMQRHDTIGIDLVAMCVNDIVCHGADPLYFLDYFATAKLQLEQGEQIISGIAAGATLAGCALIGGETAEMPGLYHGEDYDLAGFCVGVVDKKNIIQPDRIEVGDVLLALPSSGPHSNGYSLIRRVIEMVEADLLMRLVEDKTLGETLLTPTKIYVKALQALWQRVRVHGLAHITGGGLQENVPRMLPSHCAAYIDRSSWQWPEIFQWIQRNGNIVEHEMQATFNLGVGMVVAIAANEVELALSTLKQAGEAAWVMGEVVRSDAVSPQVVWSV